MLSTFIPLRESGYLVNNERGEVSFEYVIVVALIIGVVAIAFAFPGNISATLTTEVTAINTAVTTALAG